MQNEKLRTKNEILTTLNETYYVTKRWECARVQIPNAYDVYYRPEGGGLYFLCTLIAPNTRRKSVIFNDKEYDNIDTLLESVEEYNKTLMFPSRCYDPMYTVWAVESMKISWYLTEKLGMKMGKHDGGIGTSYYLNDNFGKTLFDISFNMDYESQFKKDKDVNSSAGTMVKHFGNAYLTMTFSDAEDAISQLNSVITAELISNINSSFNVLENFSGNFSSMDNAKITSVEMILQGREKSYKDVVIPILEKLLNTLKNETD